jgi:hypothetical protein
MAADPAGEARLRDRVDVRRDGTVALKTAAKTGYPGTAPRRLVGGSEEDVVPAGDAAKGYVSASFTASGTGFPVMRHQDQGVWRERAASRIRRGSAT